jgi:hypothetical protein
MVGDRLEHLQVGVERLATRPRSDSPQPGLSYWITVRRAASGAKNARTAGSRHSSSRWLIQAAGTSSAGPRPAVAYATRTPADTAQKRIWRAGSGSRASPDDGWRIVDLRKSGEASAMTLHDALGALAS